PIVAGNPQKSGVYEEIAEDKMPPIPKKLNADELKALHEWIANGAPEVSGGPVPGPMDPPTPTYEWLSKFLLGRRCGSCHGIPFKTAKIDFTSYQTLIASKGKSGRALIPNDPEHSTIYIETSTGHMPPKRKTVTESEV